MKEIGARFEGIARWSLFIQQFIAISNLPVSTGYDDKLQRAIDAADPGAVPGGSTICLDTLA